MTDKYKYTNKLIDETSPYLLQHAHNPVYWFPWGDEASRKRKTKTSPHFFRLAMRHVIGAMLWSGNRLETRKSQRSSMEISFRSKTTAMNTRATQSRCHARRVQRYVRLSVVSGES